MITPERWHTISEILEQALELSPDKRARFLDLACSSDPSLRSEVQSLLSAHEELLADLPASLTVRHCAP